MKVAIEILSTLSEPSVTNIQTMKDTMVSLANEYSDRLDNHYDFYFYYGGYSKDDINNDIEIEKDGKYENCYTIKLPLSESIYNTYEKGITVLKNISGYDWYLRINISCYINILLLDKILPQFDADTVYCNAINSYINDEEYFNDLYPRGDMTIFSENTRRGILSNCEKYYRCDINEKHRLNIPHVDDCLFGLCLIDYFGPEYYKHLQMLKYNYIPDIDISKNKTVSLFRIGNRVKTNPPGITYSGYSWDDNEYRRLDAEKMKFLNKEIKELSYSIFDRFPLEVLLSYERPTIFVGLQNRKVKDFYTYLNKKRGIV